MSTEPTAAIHARLDAIEADHGVRIVFACESGSRAWGFASRDSDYDVRFLYVHPRDWYLSVDLEHRRDVIELPLADDLDINGWDLRKALKLLRKSNPPLLEWLGSPIVYREHRAATTRIRDLLPAYYSPGACAHHYLHMARGNFREYLRGETVWRKKYLYVLRPVLAVMWIERDWGIVPTEFQVLVDALVPPGGLRNAVEKLLADKRQGQEMDRGPHIPELTEFLHRELGRLEQTPPRFPRQSLPHDQLNETFRAVLADAWEK